MQQQQQQQMMMTQQQMGGMQPNMQQQMAWQQQQMAMRNRASSDPRMMGIRSVEGGAADAALAQAAVGGQMPMMPSSGFGFIQPALSSPQQPVAAKPAAPDSFNFVTDALASARGT